MGCTLWNKYSVWLTSVECQEKYFFIRTPAKVIYTMNVGYDTFVKRPLNQITNNYDKHEVFARMISEHIIITVRANWVTYNPRSDWLRLIWLSAICWGMTVWYAYSNTKALLMKEVVIHKKLSPPKHCRAPRDGLRGRYQRPTWELWSGIEIHGIRWNDRIYWDLSTCLGIETIDDTWCLSWNVLSSQSESSSHSRRSQRFVTSSSVVNSKQKWETQHEYCSPLRVVILA